MATATLKQLPKATAELEITIPWSEIAESYQTVFNKVASEAEIPGFRKGKAPKELVEKNIDRGKIFQEVVQIVIPKAYAESVKQHKLMPVTNPKVEVVKAKENEDWVVKAQIALKPIIRLGKYQEAIRALKKPKADIWVPGKDKNTEPKKEEKIPLDTLMKVLLENIEVEISDILVTDEANRLLADLVDQTKQLGMTVEQYLMAKGKTSESVRAEYAQQAESNLKIQFGLSEIADSEKITVTEKDIEELVSKVEKPEERQRLKQDTYYLAHLLRQQKTLDFLQSL